MLVLSIKISWRNLLKDRQFSLLNLLGLSTGLACAFLIYLWVADEYSRDKYNANDERLYQVMQNIYEESGIETSRHTAGLLAPALAAEMPEVAYAATVLPASWFQSKGVVTWKETRLKAGGQFISKDYFRIFSCPVINGDVNRLFTDKRTIAISDALAEKLFGEQNPVGQTVDWNQVDFNGSYYIAAVTRMQIKRSFLMNLPFEKWAYKTL